MAAGTRTHVVAIGAALACLVLAGCARAAVLDRTEAPEESLARVRGAAARVTEAGTARFSMTMRTVFAGEQVAASTATSVGTYDYAAHKGQMDTTVKMAGIPFRTTERTLVIGSDVYTKLPEQPDLPEGGPPADGVSPFPPGEHHKPWTKLELPKELAHHDGFGPGFGPGLGEGPGDPTEALQYLKAASSDVKVVGQERVRGVPTTRYAVTFDTAEHAARVPEELGGLEEPAPTLAAPADVWIDEQGRLRKIHYALTTNVQGEGSAGRMTAETTLELYDFGVEVRITPPPADQVEVVRIPDGPGSSTHRPSSAATSAGQR